MDFTGKSRKEIQDAIKARFGRSFVSLRELCMIGELNYANIVQTRPKYIMKKAHRLGSSMCFEGIDAARIIKRSTGK